MTPATLSPSGASMKASGTRPTTKATGVTSAMSRERSGGRAASKRSASPTQASVSPLNASVTASSSRPPSLANASRASARGREPRSPKRRPTNVASGGLRSDGSARRTRFGGSCRSTTMAFVSRRRRQTSPAAGARGARSPKSDPKTSGESVSGLSGRGRGAGAFRRRRRRHATRVFPRRYSPAAIGRSASPRSAAGRW